MEVADPEVKLGNSDRENKGSDQEKSAMKMEMDGDDEEVEDLTPYGPFGLYYEQWMFLYGRRAKFEDATQFPPMRRTDGPMLRKCNYSDDTMEIYYVKVAQITGKLQWPLDVYGDVAVRDSLDNLRNYVFRRSRDRCQTLTSPQDSLLELTGPTRAVVLLDPIRFEIYLRVKAKEESEEDTVLCCGFFTYNTMVSHGNKSFATTDAISTEHGKVEVRFGHIMCSWEATFTCRVVHGSGNICARLTTCIESLVEEVVVLLDTRGRAVTVTDDGEIVLQRRVVVVEELGKLIIGVKAAQLGDGNTEFSSTLVEKKMTFRAMPALRNECYFVTGSTKVHIVIAWSIVP